MRERISREIRREYSEGDVARLQSGVSAQRDTLAGRGARRLQDELESGDHVAAQSVRTGKQAVRMMRAGMSNIYLDGAGLDGKAQLCALRQIEGALTCADRIDRVNGISDRDWHMPIVSDMQVGLEDPHVVFARASAMIEAGVAAVHLEDTAAVDTVDGRAGGRVLLGTGGFIGVLNAVRLAADVRGVPTVIVARTAAFAESWVAPSDDPRDRTYEIGPCSSEGYHEVESSIDSAIARALSYAPYVDAIGYSTDVPDLADARLFARAVHGWFPGKPLIYKCALSSDKYKRISAAEVDTIRAAMVDLGFGFQLITFRSEPRTSGVLLSTDASEVASETGALADASGVIRNARLVNRILAR